MAPLKEAETTVATTTTVSAPTNPPAAKPSAEATTRTQPVALEIPVTINGAHTVQGSDKREPFSEATQTVLVFGHGAVVRVATALAPGQLVFLTNEKSKKEVVCQVVKSKSGGSGNTYVELQFTEPAPGFWGLRTPAAPVPPPAPAPRPVASTVPAPAPPKAVPPPPPSAASAKPVTSAPKPAVPSVMAPPPAPPSAPKPVPVSTESHAPVAPPAPSVPPAAPILSVPESPAVHAAPPAPASDSSALPKETPAVPPLPPLRDYSKEIDAIFSVPSASTSHPAPPAEHKPIPPSPDPVSEQLKQQAARLQAQLSSMLFTESPAPSNAAAAPPAPPAVPQAPASDVAKKVLEIAHEPKPTYPAESKPVPPLPVKPPVSSRSAEDEEVKIPAWLAPLSQHTESAVAEPPTPASASSTAEVSDVVAESSEDSAESFQRPQTAVFGGQLLGEAAADTASQSSPGSRKGLFIGLAAAAVLALGGGAWYLRPTLFGSSPVASTKSASVPSAAASSPATAPPVADAVSSSAPSAVNPAPAPAASQRVSAPVSSPSVPVASAEPRNPNTASRNVPPPPEPAKKPVLGDVHLAAPVVSRGAESQASGEPLPTIDAREDTSGADALSDVAAGHGAQPTAPLPVGGDVKPAQLIKSTPPIYPPIAKTEHVAGKVLIDALIDSSGNVAQLKIISGPALLHRAALDAVKQWKYKPAVLDGQPTSMHLTVTVEFRAQ